MVRRPAYPVPIWKWWPLGRSELKATNGTTNIFMSLEENEPLSTTERILLGFFFGFVIVLALTGNSLVVMAVFVDRRLRQNVKNYFFASLAMADMLVTAAVMTIAAVNDLQGWVFVQGYCTIWISTDVMCATSSILNLCVISYVRYKHIQDPLRCNTWLTSRMAGGLIAGVWVVSFVISFIPIQLDWHVPPQSEPVPDSPFFDNETAGTSNDAFVCFIDFSPAYAISSSMVSFYIPAAFMMYFYSRLFVVAHKHAKMLRQIHTAESLPPQSSVTPDSVTGKSSRVSVMSLRKLSEIRVPLEYKAVCTLGIVLGCFLVCWLPFFIVNVIASICKDCLPFIVFQVCTWLGYFNSCLNPLIYAIFNREFRSAFRQILLLDYLRWICYAGREDSQTFVVPVTTTAAPKATRLSGNTYRSTTRPTFHHTDFKDTDTHALYE